MTKQTIVILLIIFGLFFVLEVVWYSLFLYQRAQLNKRPKLQITLQPSISPNATQTTKPSKEHIWEPGIPQCDDIQFVLDCKSCGTNPPEGYVA